MKEVIIKADEKGVNIEVNGTTLDVGFMYAGITAALMSSVKKNIKNKDLAQAMHYTILQQAIDEVEIDIDDFASDYKKVKKNMEKQEEKKEEDKPVEDEKLADDYDEIIKSLKELKSVIDNIMSK